MSSKYQKPLTIPEGYPALLKGFTREVLRSQPDNVYDFGAKYFKELLQHQSERLADETLPDKPDIKQSQDHVSQHVHQAADALDIASLTPGQIEPIVLGLFLEADTDGSGYLDRSEFARVLKAGNLNLSDRQIRQILAEADENDSGVIEYREFLPVMIDLLQGIKAAEQARQMMSEAEDAVRGQVESMLLHGMSQDQLQAVMTRVFEKADTDGSGYLDRQEFKQALRAAEMGLTRKDINLIMSQVDTNHDGQISYKEFIPVCFKILVERFKDEVMINDVLNNTDGLQGILLEYFQAADPEGSGLLPPSDVKAIMKDLSFQMLGLSTLQLATLLGQAPVTPEGLVQYIQFIPLAAAMVSSMYNVDSMKLRMQAIQELSAGGGVQQLSGMDMDGLKQRLAEAFQAVDADGTGQLELHQVMEVLSSLDTLSDGSSLSDGHKRAIFTAIDTDDSGTVDWAELVNFVCDVLEHFEREAYVSQWAKKESLSGQAI